ncbi:Na+/H+ antiporter [Candidatus Woesearchaeota archaeon]|nr:Na+/H+ antiporter [Candidatus Woesearchaeota archaeon]
MVLILPDIQLQLLSLFMLAVAVTVIVKYIRLPYTIALVITGLVVGSVGYFNIPLNKEIILFLFLPPLLFEAAVHIDFKEMVDSVKPILVFSIPGIFAGVFLVSVIINFITGIPLIYCLLFGAMVLPTDPVSVLALFKNMGVSKSLTHIIEGESLMNDGTAIVLFAIILDVIQNNHFSLAFSIFSFLKSYIGGILIGISIGYLTIRLLQKILADDSVVVVLVTIIVAYLTFIICEDYFHVSGVIGVVAAGLFIGHKGTKYAMSSSSKIAITSFWGIVAFIVNSLIFIMIGIKMPVKEIIGDWWLIFLAIVTVTFVRSIIIYLLSTLLNMTGEKIPAKWQHVINIGGIHGSIPIALLLGLHLTDYMKELSAMTYGVVLFSVVIQGSLIPPLLKKLNIASISKIEAEYETNLAKKLAIKNARKQLKKMYLTDQISEEIYRKLDKSYNQKFEEVTEKIRENLLYGDMIRTKQIKTAKRKAYLAEKVSIREAIKSGIISFDRGYTLLKQVDQKLDSIDQ